MGEEQENGLSMLMIPLLIAAALFLLFPSVRQVPVNNTGRRKREADDSAASIVNRIQDMSLALMESEECMERVACEGETRRIVLGPSLAWGERGVEGKIPANSS